MKFNHEDDIMTGQLYERFRFLEGDRIIVTRKKNGIYSLEAPDTKPYSNLEVNSLRGNYEIPKLRLFTKFHLLVS